MYGPVTSRYGALPSQTIRALMHAGFIRAGTEEHVAPASLDLTLSEEVYRTNGVFQVRAGEAVRDLVHATGAERHTLDRPLERGSLYLARLNETIELPAGVYGYCNPKSSTGRLDVHVRVLADGVPRYDSLVPHGWSGSLWIAIHPKSFSIALTPGFALSQLRLFTADTRFSELDLEVALAEHRLLWHRGGTFVTYRELTATDRDGAPVLTLAFDGPSVGFVSRSTDRVLDLTAVGAYDPRDFFDEVISEDGRVRLDRDNFYILSTNEAVRIPPELACEMVPMDERSGDFRSHYAGFIDPGWGWGVRGEGCGRPLTLEVRPFEDLVVRRDQPIAKIRFERMTHVPDVLYDTRASNYRTQSGPRLAKQFREIGMENGPSL